MVRLLRDVSGTGTSGLERIAATKAFITKGTRTAKAPVASPFLLTAGNRGAVAMGYEPVRFL